MGFGKLEVIGEFFRWEFGAFCIHGWGVFINNQGFLDLEQLAGGTDIFGFWVWGNWRSRGHIYLGFVAVNSQGVEKSEN